MEGIYKVFTRETSYFAKTEFLVILNGMGTSIASPLDYCRRTQDVKLHRALWL